MFFEEKLDVKYKMSVGVLKNGYFVYLWTGHIYASNNQWDFTLKSIDFRFEGNWILIAMFDIL